MQVGKGTASARSPYYRDSLYCAGFPSPSLAGRSSGSGFFLLPCLPICKRRQWLPSRLWGIVPRHGGTDRAGFAPASLFSRLTPKGQAQHLQKASSKNSKNPRLRQGGKKELYYIGVPIVWRQLYICTGIHSLWRKSSVIA